MSKESKNKEDLNGVFCGTFENGKMVGDPIRMPGIDEIIEMKTQEDGKTEKTLVDINDQTKLIEKFQEWDLPTENVSMENLQALREMGRDDAGLFSAVQNSISNCGGFLLTPLVFAVRRRFGN